MQQIHRYPDDILKLVAAPVRDIDGKLMAFLDEMAQTMYAAPGVGLAAPQVGLSERAIVLDCDSAEERAERRGRGVTATSEAAEERQAGDGGIRHDVVHHSDRCHRSHEECQDHQPRSHLVTVGLRAG